jgi:uncharacterized Fe-S cluster-containing protein
MNSTVKIKKRLCITVKKIVKILPDSNCQEVLYVFHTSALSSMDIIVSRIASKKKIMRKL